jgi:sirohydrochlorin ferrochelatase
MDGVKGLLLMAHGSRRAEANADLEHVAAAMAARGRYPVVQVSYLELAEPDIPTGGARCVERGATDVVMLPYFLSPGVHVREDMEEARAALAGRFPHVRFRLAEPLGRHPLLLDVVEQRAAEAGGPAADAPPDPPPGRYRHFKGNEYEVVGVARHSETGERLVVYRPLYGDGGLWVRPLGMFAGAVEHAGRTVPRFAFVGG